MAKINVTGIKASEDIKKQLQQEIVEVKKEKQLLEEVYSLKFEEAKKAAFNSLSAYFEGEEFKVKPTGEFDFIAQYGDKRISIYLFDENTISVVALSEEPGGEPEKIKLSPNKGNTGTVTSFHSGDKDREVIALEMNLQSLKNDIANLKEGKIYYHYSSGVDLDFSKVIANIFN